MSNHYWRGLRAYGRGAAFLACRLVAGSAEPRSAVLMYHRIGGRAGVPVAMLDRQLAYVVGHFRVVPLRDLSDALATGARVAALTFDDGTLDHHEVALPVLERHGVPGTFFPVVAHVREADAGRGPSGTGPSMGTRHLLDLVRRGHEVGAHTVTHPVLPALPDEEVRREVSESRAALEDLLGEPVTSFAYPKGRWDDRARRAVADAGFAQAVTVREATLPADVDWLTIPRVGVHPATGMVQFRAKLGPALDVYERLRGRRRDAAPAGRGS